MSVIDVTNAGVVAGVGPGLVPTYTGVAVMTNWGAGHASTTPLL